jgi:hypothetical protein
MSGSPVSGADLALLVAVLDRLLPENGDLAGAGGLGLGGQIPATAAAPVLAALPAAFTSLDAAAATAALQAVEAAQPAAFAELLKFAYIAYYRDPRVLARIEQATGYANRPPQPLGYTLEPLDPTLLDVVKARGPQYRDTREITS